MTAFLLRRLAQLVPTLLGALALTFLLFNLVGGSPAALTLGEHASPLALEEFDEARGMNKPLFIGRWGPTRALGPVPRACAPGVHPLPWTFPPRGGAPHRLTLRLRAAAPGGAATARLIFPGVGSAGGKNVQALETFAVSSSKRWKTVAWGWTPTPDTPPPALEIAGGAVATDGGRLQRGNAGWGDSQFSDYLRRLARLDFGWSAREQESVAHLLRAGIGPTLALTVPVFTGGIVLALLLALAAAYGRNRWPDRLLVFAAVAVMSVNYLVWISLGQYFFAFRLNWFPVWGFSGPRDLVLPAAIGIFCGLGADVRLYRAFLLEELGRDYVRTAVARGAGPGRVMFRHVLRNALIPVVTHVATTLPYLYTGSLLLESFFGIPGLGYLSVNALNSADLDVLRAVVVVGTVLYLLAGLAADLAYAALDPRVKLG